jgi:hypothetical protein
MANETLEQWASRMAAARVSVQQPRPQLNRRSLVEAEQSRRALQAATAAHEQRLAQRDAARAAAPAAAQAPSPSLGGGFIARVAGLVMPRAEPPAPAATSTDTRRKGMRPS